MNELEHDWFAQQLATYLADGLNADERSRFEAHARACESCAHELDEAREERDPRLVPAHERWRFEPGRGWVSGSDMR